MLTSQLTAEMMFAYFYWGKVSTHHRGSSPQPYTSWVCSIGICCDLSSEWCTAGSWCRVCSWSSAGWSDGRIPKILSALVPLLWLWPTKYLNNAGVSLWWSHIKQGLTFVSWHRFEPLLEPLTQIFPMHPVKWLSKAKCSLKSKFVLIHNVWGFEELDLDKSILSTVICEGQCYEYIAVWTLTPASYKTRWKMELNCQLFPLSFSLSS